MQQVLRPEAMWTYIFHEPINLLKGVFSCLARWTNHKILPGVILETKGSVRKIQKGHLFTTKKLKRAHLIWCPPMFTASVQLFWSNKFLKKISYWGQCPEAGLSFSLKQPLIMLQYFIILWTSVVSYPLFPLPFWL